MSGHPRGDLPLGDGPPVAGGLDVDLPGSGIRLRATRWRGTGTPVLLLHGLASTRRFWDLVAPGLAGLPVVALDQRGHGDSAAGGPFDGATIAADALTALDALGWSRAVVVGHSWGAATAVRLAAHSPDRVLSVVAIDGGFGSARAAGRTHADARTALTPARTALPPDELTRRISTGPLAPWWSPAVAAALLPLFGVHADGLARPRLAFDDHMAIVDDLLTVDPSDWFGSVRCPAWLVSCEPLAEDAWSTAKASALDRAAELLALPRLHRWRGAVHDVPLQWPALVSGLVRAAAQEAAAGLVPVGLVPVGLGREGDAV